MNDTTQFSTDTWQKIQTKLAAECNRIGNKIPYIPLNDFYEDIGEKNISWWTNGFWGRILWQMYHATGNEIYARNAKKTEERLDEALSFFNDLDHDVGFLWLPTAMADYRLTQDKKSLSRILHAASILAGRFNPQGQFLRAWNGDKTGWIIVDSLMNISLLYQTSELIHDPRFKYTAMKHADTVLEKIVRQDGSCNHIVILDPDTGDLLETPAGQGYESGSSWSRGQAWALYGFALSYRYTKESRYLDAAKKICHYFIACIAQTDFIPFCDFRAPEIPLLYDTTAGACAACGMLELAEMVPLNEKSLYYGTAVKILQAIAEKHCNWNPNTDSIVSNGCVAYSECKQESIIYGDYFFIEGILRLLNKAVVIW